MANLLRCLRKFDCIVFIDALKIRLFFLDKEFNIALNVCDIGRILGIDPFSG